MRRGSFLSGLAATLLLITSCAKPESLQNKVWKTSSQAYSLELKGDYSGAIEYYIKTINMLTEKNPDHLVALLQAYGGLSNCHDKLKDEEKAKIARDKFDEILNILSPPEEVY